MPLIPQKRSIYSGLGNGNERRVYLSVVLRRVSDAACITRVDALAVYNFYLYEGGI